MLHRPIEADTGNVAAPTSVRSFRVVFQYQVVLAVDHITVDHVESDAVVQRSQHVLFMVDLQIVVGEMADAHRRAPVAIGLDVDAQIAFTERVLSEEEPRRKAVGYKH